ncbi:MAG: hypothetical protein NTV22_12245 [bacterium]|nr:hypothetical protein [bacterium]
MNAPFSLSSFVGVAAFFIVLTQQTTAAPPITDHRLADALTIPPVAGLQAADAPLIPQSVPLSSVQSLLNLAGYSACRAAAQAIEQGNIAGGLAMLDKLAEGALHWRGAVTNGYQQGFFVNALRGYCLENTGDIVKAYRAYQNSRAYFNDEAAAVQCPEPRLEVFLGLGRTCLVAGRYTDAFNWLDLVRLEASAVPRIAALADRALIRRAVEIGDYYDAITNYVDLQCLILETGNLKLEQSGSDLRAANAVVDETSGHGSLSHTNTNPASNVAVTEDYKFVRRERIYAPEEYTELAQLYFWTQQDRPGFQALLDGMARLGIDNDLGIKDPLLNLFMHNIMRTDDAEIQRFYDVLGYAITQARAQKGDEEYVALLINTRTLLKVLYGYLVPCDDLAALSSRVARLVQSCPPHIPKRTTSDAENMRHAKQLNGVCEASETPNSAATQGWEDCLMEADWLLDKRNVKAAYAAYERAAHGLMDTQTPLEYDGCAARVAANVGLLLSGTQTTAWLQWQLPAAHVMDTYTRTVYANCGQAPFTTGCTDAIDQCIVDIYPRSHPRLIAWLNVVANRQLQSFDFDGFIGTAAQIIARAGALPNNDMYGVKGIVYAANDRPDLAVAAWLDGIRCRPSFSRQMNYCLKTPAWLTPALLPTFERALPAALLLADLTAQSSGFLDARQCHQRVQEIARSVRAMHEAVQHDNADAVKTLLRGPGARLRSYDVCEVLLRHGDTNEAFQCFASAFAEKASLVALVDGLVGTAPWREGDAVRALVGSVEPMRGAAFVANLVNLAKTRSHSNQLQDCLARFAESLKSNAIPILSHP